MTIAVGAEIKIKEKKNAKPIEYFNLLFTPSLWTLMVEKTNGFAQQLLLSPKISAHSRITRWYPVTVLEIKAFVAVLLEMSITRRPTICSYWTEDSRKIPWFNQMLSRNRFQLILRCFYLINNKGYFPPDNEAHDAYAKFYPIIEHANTMFKLYYMPHKELSIDKSLAGILSRSSIMSYLPSKKNRKRRIKLWMLRDATSNYCITFYCDNGTKPEINNDVQQVQLGYNVVVNLLQQSDCLNKGHHVYTDHFLTSTVLAKFLYSKKTYLTGTIMRSQRDIPDIAKEIKLGKTKYIRNDKIFLCGYRKEKSLKEPAMLISTQTSARGIMVVRKRHSEGRQKTIPSIIDAYNLFTGRVDESDEMLYTYLDERRTLKYWKKITFNIFIRMLLNSYIIYKESVGKKAVSRVQYTSDIISQIERDWTQEKKRQSIINEKKTYGLMKLPGRNLRQCVVCSNKTTGIRRSNLICAQCKKGLHPLCLDKHICM